MTLPQPPAGRPAPEKRPLAPGLYLVATPLGNLGDLTFRAAETLAGAALVAAEDTRRARKLLAGLGLRTPLISYRQHNHRQAWPKIAEALRRNLAVALVTDAGSPAISDPGAYLAAQARAEGFSIFPLPGPSAVVLALTASGLPADQFLFAGFPPAKASARRKFLAGLKTVPYTMVFFEAPHRLAASLADMAEVFGPRPAVMARELTKMHEEITGGSLAALAAEVEARPRRGEITLVVGGAPAEAETRLEAGDIEEQARLDPRPAKVLAAELAPRSRLSRSEVYRLITAARRFEAEKPGN